MEEKKNIGTLFDGIAVTYDKLNHLLSLNIDKWWRKRTVKGLRRCDSLLDVAIGTADLAIEIVKRDKAEHVQGLDLSAEMMKIGEQKVAKLGYADRIAFELGSALEMPYADASYDAVTCAYGVRNFSDLDKGLSEFYRVMKPGGQLAILEFSYPTNPIVRFAYDTFFTYILPLIGRIISRDQRAYSYLRDSVKDFIWGKDMTDRIEKAGFKNATYNTLTFGITTIYMAEKPHPQPLP